MVKDDLGNRMKKYYEEIPKLRLMRRTPVIIRIDGKAFHTFTRKFLEPFDEVFLFSMQETAKALCESIQGCVLAYTQSDEISLLLIDYNTFETQAWFDYEVQKVCSVSASIATMQFNKILTRNGAGHKRFEKALEMGAMFDSRCFNLPREEVTNYFYWRQLDASRNSVNSVAQSIFPHKELHKLSCNALQDKMFSEAGVNWNDFPTYQKRGACVVKESVLSGDDSKYGWVIDREIPIFKGVDREYIDRLVNVGE